jgi:hypothetical protein
VAERGAAAGDGEAAPAAIGAGAETLLTEIRDALVRIESRIPEPADDA